MISIAIPNSVTSIGENALQYCNNLDTIEVYWEEPNKIGSTLFTGSPIATATLIVPTGSKEAYEAASVWNSFGAIVEREATANNP